MTTSTSAVALQIQAHGAVAAADLDHLRSAVDHALERAPGPVLFARAKVSVLPDPALAGSAVVQVNVDLNGRSVRVQAARGTVRAAIDEVRDRLDERLERVGAGRRRHTGFPVDAPRHRDLPPELRQIVRRKTFALRRMTVDDAAAELELLGYHFHLFTEDGTGSDSILYRVDDDPPLRLSQLDPRPGDVTPGSEWISVSPQRPPTLRLRAAVQRLDVTGWPFVFFRNAVTGRGCVLYHRYDGHYGLLTAAG